MLSSGKLQMWSGKGGNGCVVEVIIDKTEHWYCY